MSSSEPHVPDPASQASTDLWKFFEQRGVEQKESMFKLVTWIVGFAAVVLGFAVKEGFETGLEKVSHRGLLFALGGIGLVVLGLAGLFIIEHGRHINRTFARADAARDGESSPRSIWQAGRTAQNKWLPAICWQLLGVVVLFAAGFAIIIIRAAVEPGGVTIF